MKQEIKKILFFLSKKLTAKKNKKETIKFKTGIWQTEEISKAFIKASNGNEFTIADVMDKEVNEFFLSNCNNSDKVLDIGCGHGIVSEFIAENNINVTAIDISEKLLESFKERVAGRNLPIEIKKGDAYNIPSNDNHFDVVVARMFLPHFPDWPTVLTEMARVTKKGGKLLVHFSTAENTYWGREMAIKDCHFVTTPDPSDPWTFYAETNTTELLKVCKKIGISLVERTPVSFFMHNRILGYQLGTEVHNSYMNDFQNYLKDEKVKEFVLWFDKQVIAKCSPAISHFNIITFKK